MKNIESYEQILQILKDADLSDEYISALNIVFSAESSSKLIAPSMDLDILVTKGVVKKDDTGFVTAYQNEVDV